LDTYSSSTNNSLVQKLVTAIILAVAFFISAGMVVYLSLRGKEVKVPDLIGKSEGDAEKLLAKEGLRLKVRPRPTDEKVPATLIGEQTPNGGVTVKAGQVVTVTLGDKNEKKEDANLAAKPVASATAKPKPKPKPSPSPSPGNNKGKDAATDSNKNSKDETTKGKESNNASTKGKPSPSPSVKASPKPSAKPSPKKPGTN
jgi:hypothetical protein